jgi:hypothetical protein
MRGRVSRFHQANQRWPTALAELLYPDDIVDYRNDAWGTPLRYGAGGVSFEIRSAGSDRQFSTADDLFATQDQMSPRPR